VPKIIIEWRGIGNSEEGASAADSDVSDLSDNLDNSEKSDNSKTLSCSLSERFIAP